MKDPLEEFGTFFVQNLRDKMLNKMETLLDGESKAPDLKEIQDKVSEFSNAQRLVIRELIDEIVTSGMHDLLFAIQYQADVGGEIKVLVGNQEVAKLSDGLHEEIFGEDGWIVRYSKYPSEAEIERSREAKEWISGKFGKTDKDNG